MNLTCPACGDDLTNVAWHCPDSRPKPCGWVKYRDCGATVYPKTSTWT